MILRTFFLVVPIPTMSRQRDKRTGANEAYCEKAEQIDVIHHM